MLAPLALLASVLVSGACRRLLRTDDAAPQTWNSPVGPGSFQDEDADGPCRGLRRGQGLVPGAAPPGATLSSAGPTGREHRSKLGIRCKPPTSVGIPRMLKRTKVRRLDCMLQLQPGHIHQGISASGAVAVVWPAPKPGYWHVSLLGYPPRASEAPVPGEKVEDLLEEWQFRPEKRWRSWAGPTHATNPTLRQITRGP